jgi:hypothetical protein
MRAAVPEELGHLDLVGTADGRLRGDHAHVVLAFLELPLARCDRRFGLCHREDDRLAFGFGLGGGFLDDLERFALRLGRLVSRGGGFRGGRFDGGGLVGNGSGRFFLAAGGQQARCGQDPDQVLR